MVMRPTPSSRSQIAGTSSIADPVVLDVVAVGDVRGVPGVRRRRLAEGAELVGAEDLAVGAHSHHEEAVVELLLLELGGLAAVEAGSALGVEAHPSEATAQVGRVDGVEAALGVDVLDAGPDVERVVVLLGLLVLVQRLGVAERPLALAALAAYGRGSGLGGSAEGQRWSRVAVILSSLRGRARR